MVTRGVLLGSVLGPVLFNNLINDLDRRVQSIIKKLLMILNSKVLLTWRDERSRRGIQILCGTNTERNSTELDTRKNVFPVRMVEH